MAGLFRRPGGRAVRRKNRWPPARPEGAASFATTGRWRCGRAVKCSIGDGDIRHLTVFDDGLYGPAVECPVIVQKPESCPEVCAAVFPFPRFDGDGLQADVRCPLAGRYGGMSGKLAPCRHWGGQFFRYLLLPCRFTFRLQLADRGADRRQMPVDECLVRTVEGFFAGQFDGFFQKSDPVVQIGQRVIPEGFQQGEPFFGRFVGIQGDQFQVGIGVVFFLRHVARDTVEPVAAFDHPVCQGVGQLRQPGDFGRQRDTVFGGDFSGLAGKLHDFRQHDRELRVVPYQFVGQLQGLQCPVHFRQGSADLFAFGAAASHRVVPDGDGFFERSDETFGIDVLPVPFFQCLIRRRRQQGFQFVAFFAQCFEILPFFFGQRVFRIVSGIVLRFTRQDFPWRFRWNDKKRQADFFAPERGIQSVSGFVAQKSEGEGFRRKFRVFFQRDVRNAGDRFGRIEIPDGLVVFCVGHDGQSGWNMRGRTGRIFLSGALRSV